MRVEPFAVDVPDAVLDDLRSRIRGTRWPDPAPGEPWSQGVDLEFLRDLLAYWADGFDWRAQEARLNRYDHHLADVDGRRLHLVRGGRGDGDRLPLLLPHGWPSSFLEMLPLVDRLGDRFDLVVPSLPGYAFSHPAAAHGGRPGLRRRRLPRLMPGSATSGTARTAATSVPAWPRAWRCRGPTGRRHPPGHARDVAVHGAGRAAAVGGGAGVRRPRRRAGTATERGYSAVQSTRPQTLGYALNDSPAGLAAWVLDKWRSWSDSGGDLEGGSAAMPC